MKVNLDKTFPLPCSPEAGWEVLKNVEAVAKCMPGAELTEQLDATHYKGTVTVKVGPATMSFRGELDVKDIDPAARSLRLVGKGTDRTGSSGASMELRAKIDASESGSALVGSSEVSVSGKAASFGGRMMNAVADQVLKQFAANFAEAASASQAPRSDPRDRRTAPPEPSQRSFAAGKTATAVGPDSHELNAFALVWAAFKDWLRGLFSKRAP